MNDERVDIKTYPLPGGGLREVRTHVALMHTTTTDIYPFLRRATHIWNDTGSSLNHLQELMRQHSDNLQTNNGIRIRTENPPADVDLVFMHNAAKLKVAEAPSKDPWMRSGGDGALVSAGYDLQAGKIIGITLDAEPFKYNPVKPPTEDNLVGSQILEVNIFTPGGFTFQEATIESDPSNKEILREGYADYGQEISVLGNRFSIYRGEDVLVINCVRRLGRSWEIQMPLILPFEELSPFANDPNTDCRGAKRFMKVGYRYI